MLYVSSSIFPFSFNIIFNISYVAGSEAISHIQVLQDYYYFFSRNPFLGILSPVEYVYRHKLLDAWVCTFPSLLDIATLLFKVAVPLTFHKHGHILIFVNIMWKITPCFSYFRTVLEARSSRSRSPPSWFLMGILWLILHYWKMDKL